MNNKKQLNWQVLSKNILTQSEPNRASSIYYVGLFKESGTGLFSNERMLVIQDLKYTIFYTKYFKTLPSLLSMQKQGTTAIKQRFLIKDCRALQQQNHITLSIVNEDQVQKKWSFVFYSEQLAKKWLQLFEEVQEKYINRTIKSKQTKSTGFASEYSSILNNINLIDNFQQDSPMKQQQSSEGTRMKRVYIKKIEHQSK